MKEQDADTDIIACSSANSGFLVSPVLKPFQIKPLITGVSAEREDLDRKLEQKNDQRINYRAKR
jgi:hypothetical protein